MSRTFKHDGCVGCKYEKESETSDYCNGCKQNAVDKYVRITNADRIRSMTDDEMAEFLVSMKTEHIPCMVGDGICKYENYSYKENDKGCKDCFKEWLEMEVEG